MLWIMIFLLPFLCFSIFLIIWFFLTPLKPKNVPPSPPKFPIIGNLHQLGLYPHRSLHSLAQTYGPLMMLQFGTVPILIVSTADAAREIMKTHDLVFSCRPKLSVLDKLLYAGRDVSTAPYAFSRTDSYQLQDMFAGGTDSTYTVLEWAMTELIKNPRVMKQAQDEVRKIASGNRKLTEGDLKTMHYLKAVIKETLRLHPPFPLLVPRRSTQDVKINGYDIAAGTVAFTNAWAIGRDPVVWDQPEEFRPERFLNCSTDFKGHDFELIPFGAGRRGCPGISFAMATNELVLANLVNEFDWSLPNGARVDDLDMTESLGIIIHRKVPLLVVATPSS